ncbi:MAG: methylamine dehydrogenase light chain [Gammaproteobacteria bacterium]|jgi:methylamine dehydrogenase light chain|nr:methylamine dehydrogenase light chain [Gammaproteobacteria bacterium]
MSNRDQLLDQLLRDLDAATTGAVRFLSSRTSRRSFFGRLGVLLAGVGAVPVLPVLREAQAQSSDGDIPDMGDVKSCDYWRYCAFSGSLCSCCGGTLTRCPPGTEVATVAWVGTCHNPADGRDYLISYNDCCGKGGCGRCGCHGSEGDRPVYFPGKSNSILWCFGSSSHAYHCTLARILGVEESNVAQ